MLEDKRKEAEKQEKSRQVERTVGEVALAGPGELEPAVGSSVGEYVSRVGDGDYPASASQQRLVTERIGRLPAGGGTLSGGDKTDQQFDPYREMECWSDRRVLVASKGHSEWKNYGSKENVRW